MATARNKILHVFFKLSCYLDGNCLHNTQDLRSGCDWQHTLATSNWILLRRAKWKSSFHNNKKPWVIYTTTPTHLPAPFYILHWRANWTLILHTTAHNPRTNIIRSRKSQQIILYSFIFNGSISTFSYSWHWMFGGYRWTAVFTNGRSKLLKKRVKCLQQLSIIFYLIQQ